MTLFFILNALLNVVCNFNQSKILSSGNGLKVKEEKKVTSMPSKAVFPMAGRRCYHLVFQSVKDFGVSY